MTLAMILLSADWTLLKRIPSDFGLMIVLYARVNMVIKLLGEPNTPAYLAAKAIIKKLGHAIYDPEYFSCDLAVAPLLTYKISLEELNEPLQGTLVFHPSPLPYGRGASSLRWAFRRQEPITAAAWIWANEILDGGDICEMEVLKIDYSMRPKDYYTSHVIPALQRTLERSLNAIERGYIHRVPQIDIYSSYDGIIK